MLGWHSERFAEHFLFGDTSDNVMQLEVRDISVLPTQDQHVIQFFYTWCHVRKHFWLNNFIYKILESLNTRASPLRLRKTFCEYLKNALALYFRFSYFPKLDYVSVTKISSTLAYITLADYW